MAKHYSITDLSSQLQSGPVSYFEFLRIASLSSGIYHLSAGSKDPQQPHDEDESYYALKGRAKVESQGEEFDVQSGTVLFVAAQEQHRFYDIEEDLELLVFFAAEPGQG